MNLKQQWQQYWAQRKNPLPQVTTPYRAELERLQKRWAIGLLLSLILLGWYAYQYTQSQAAKQAPVMVVAAQTNLAYPHTLSVPDLTLVEVPQRWVTATSWNRKEDLVGKTLRRNKEAFEVFTAEDVQADLNPKSVSAKFEEAFAFTIGEDWLAAKLPNLKGQDRVDILTANPEAGLEATVNVASNIKVVTVERSGGRKNLVVNVTQKQAQALLFSRSLRLPMQVLIHSSHNLQPNDTIINTP